MYVSIFAGIEKLIPPAATSTELHTMSHPESARPLAHIHHPNGTLEYVWNDEDRSVWFRHATGGEWIRQQDQAIVDSICDALGLRNVNDLRCSDVKQYSSGSASGSTESVTQNMSEQFLLCDWSDYACDHRLVVATLLLDEAGQV